MYGRDLCCCSVAIHVDGDLPNRGHCSCTSHPEMLSKAKASSSAPQQPTPSPVAADVASSPAVTYSNLPSFSWDQYRDKVKEIQCCGGIDADLCIVINTISLHANEESPKILVRKSNTLSYVSYEIVSPGAFLEVYGAVFDSSCALSNLATHTEIQVDSNVEKNKAGFVTLSQGCATSGNNCPARGRWKILKMYGYYSL